MVEISITLVTQQKATFTKNAFQQLRPHIMYVYGFGTLTFYEIDVVQKLQIVKHFEFVWVHVNGHINNSSH